MNIRTLIIIHLNFLISVFQLSGQEYNISSPDSHLKISINFSKETCFNVTFKGQEVVEKICIDLTLSDGRAFGSAPKVVSSKIEKFNQSTQVPVPNKDRIIESEFYQLTVFFQKKYKKSPTKSI